MSTHYPNLGRSSGLGSVFKTLTKSLKTSSKNVPVLINPTVVGGGQDLQLVFEQLKSPNLSIRASGATKMIESLDKFTISSIPEVWYLSRDLCDVKIPSQYRRIGISLMIQCIKHDDSSVGTRLMFFKDIMKFCQFKNKLDDDFDLFLEALKRLTNDGRDIHDFCIYNERANLNKFISASLELSVNEIRRAEEGRNGSVDLSRSIVTWSDISQNNTSQNNLHSIPLNFSQKNVSLVSFPYPISSNSASSSSSQNLLDILDYVKNCLKFNFTVLREFIIFSIIQNTIEIGYQTSNFQVLNSCLQLLNSIIIFGRIPLQLFSTYIEFYSSIYGRNDELNMTIWDGINCLRIQEMNPLTIASLCDCIQNREVKGDGMTSDQSSETSSDLNEKKNELSQEFVSKDLLSSPHRKLNSCLGALKLLIQIQVISASEHTEIDYSLLNIYTAMKIAVSYNIPRINSSILSLLDQLFSKNTYQTSFNITFSDTFDKILPFHVCLSPKFFDVLKGLKVNDEQDLVHLQSICSSLQELYENHELHTPKDKLINFFLQHHDIISYDNSNFILTYYNEEKLCSLFHPFWKDNCIKLLQYFFYKTSNIDIKINCLIVIKEAFNTSISVFSKNGINYDLIFEILSKSCHEEDEVLIDFLFDNLFTLVAFQGSSSVYKQLCVHFREMFGSDKVTSSNYSDKFGNDYFERAGKYSERGSFPRTSHTPIASTPVQYVFSSIFLQKMAKAVVRNFLISSTNDSSKAFESYELMISMAKYGLSHQDSDMLLILSKCLIRIRVTSENYLYFTKPLDLIGLAATFRRHIDALELSKQSKDQYKWLYPESLPYLPEKYFDKPSRNLMVLDDEVEETYTSVDISKWFTIVLDIMENFIGWEVFSFVWGHFCSQLSNVKLFYSGSDHILRLKNIICDQLTLNLPHLIILPKDITKADLQVAGVRTLSALLGFHDKFSKYDEDQIINSLIFGLGSWDKTAIPCINILTVCCYEMPASIKKFLLVILTKLQTRVTSAFASTHTLEFLMSLIHLPALTSNFTMDEYKRVFGIAFKYIQYGNDLKKRTGADENAQNIIQKHGVDAEVDQTPSTQTSELTPVLTQYLVTLSFNVIANWFLQISMNERKSISLFLMKNLVLCNDGEEIDDQTVAFLDFINRFTHSDFPLGIKSMGTFSNKGTEVSLNHWLVGISVISIETDTISGKSQMLIRRPSGETKMCINLGYESNSNGPIVDSNFFINQLCDESANGKNGLVGRPTQNLELPISQIYSPPISLAEDSIVLRALSVLDRQPTVEFHKIGVVYVGKGQFQESEVLGNKVGSRQYEQFLDKLGGLVKLKGAHSRIYLGGLDSENDMDGEYARYWRDKTTQIIFQVTTMMNTHDNQDLKKRHIGNNYVNIYFDESGMEVNFNMIKSQFNFLNIVISPHTMCVDAVAPTRKEPRQFFKVKTYRRAGVPGIFATCHFKIVSGEKLAVFIRNLAIVADQFATVWHLNGRYASNWAQRVKQIRLVKEKTERAHATLREEELELQGEHGANTTQSFLEQLVPGMGEKRANGAEND
jgi:hypothetical protein